MSKPTPNESLSAPSARVSIDSPDPVQSVAPSNSHRCKGTSIAKICATSYSHEDKAAILDVIEEVEPLCANH